MVVQYKMHFNAKVNVSLRLLHARHREGLSSWLYSVPDTRRTPSAGLMVCSRALLGLKVSELFSFSGKVQAFYDQACA